MKERKSAKANLQNQQHHHNGHLSPFKFAKLFDPDASWDKVRTLNLLAVVFLLFRNWLFPSPYCCDNILAFVYLYYVQFGQNFVYPCCVLQFSVCFLIIVN